jgi:hypothetical protein
MTRKDKETLAAILRECQERTIYKKPYGVSPKTSAFLASYLQAIEDSVFALKKIFGWR